MNSPILNILEDMKLKLLRSIVILILVSVLFIFLSLCLTYCETPLEEDAFITFRYVENFLNGNGFVFNKSERVEGISNFLWAVVLAILSRFGFALLPTSAMLGLGLGILIIWTLWLFSVLYLKSESYFQFIAPLLLSTHTSFIISCTNGLETALYTFFITIGTISFVLELREKEVFPYSAVIFSLASMTRPEAPLLFSGIMLTLIFRDLINHKLRRHTVVSSVTFCLIYGSFISFRIYYYHDIFPNTIYSKITASTLRSSILLFDFFVNTKSYFILFPALFLLFKTYAKKPFYQIVIIITVHTISLLFTTPFPRYIVPILPLSFILVQEGLFQISRILEHFSSVKGRYKEGFVLLLTVSILLTNLLGHDFGFWGKFVVPKANLLLINLKQIFANPTIIKRKFEAYNWQNTPQNFHALFGDWIRRNIPENSIILYDQMGQTPFYAGRSYTFIDSLGITDKIIAEIKYKEKNFILFKIRDLVLKLVPGVDAETYQKDLTFSGYVLSRNPDYIFILVKSKEIRRLIFLDEFNHRYYKYRNFIPGSREFNAYYRKTSVPIPKFILSYPLH